MTDPILSALTESIALRRPVALATIVTATGTYTANIGRKAVIWLDQDSLGSLALGDLETRTLADAQTVLENRAHKLLRYETAGNQVEVFVEVQHRPPTLLVVGAGHIALPLARLGSLCAFSVTIVDDRAQFATRERFPTADQIIAALYHKALREIPIDSDTYIVLVTRGHQHDIDCLLAVMDSPAAYIGMIGSRRRMNAVFALLEREKGIDRARFARVFSPIGLDIGAETPAEIALCIMAEVIKVFRGNVGSGRSLADRRQERVQQEAEGSMREVSQ